MLLFELCRMMHSGSTECSCLQEQILTSFLYSLWCIFARAGKSHTHKLYCCRFCFTDLFNYCVVIIQFVLIGRLMQFYLNIFTSLYNSHGQSIIINRLVWKEQHFPCLNFTSPFTFSLARILINFPLRTYKEIKYLNFLHNQAGTNFKHNILCCSYSHWKKNLRAI